MNLDRNGAMELIPSPIFMDAMTKRRFISGKHANYSIDICVGIQNVIHITM